jgi:hypothetical protein
MPKLIEKFRTPDGLVDELENTTSLWQRQIRVSYQNSCWAR